MDRINKIIRIIEIIELINKIKVNEVIEINRLINPIQGGGQKHLRASSSLNFDKNNHRMSL